MKKSRLFINIVMFLVIFSVLAAAVFFHIMTAPININEQNYIPGGVLYKQYTLYRDYPYVQMPYLPIIYGIFYKLTGTSYYFLTGRLFTLFFTLASAVFLYLIAYKFTGSFYYSILTPVLFCLNDVIMVPMKESSNYIMPIAFSLAGFYFFAASLAKSKTSIMGILVSGFFVSAAAGSRLLYAPIAAAYLLTVVFYPNSFSLLARIKKIILPFGLGALIGQLPTIYYMIIDYNAFVVNNLIYHSLTAKWFEMTGPFERLTFPGKWWFAFKIFRSFPGNSVLIVIFIVLLSVIFIQNKYWPLKNLKNLPYELVLIILIVVIAAITMFIPRPIYIQYFALPAPFIILFISYAYGNIKIKKKAAINLLLLAAVFAALAGSVPQYYRLAASYSGFENLTPLKVHNNAMEMRRSIGEVKDGDKVATLYPVLVLDSNLEIYNELATGLWLYPVADLIPQKYRKNLVYVSRFEIYDFFKKNQPKAILVDSNRTYDARFAKFAELKNYTKVDKDFDGYILYVRP